MGLKNVVDQLEIGSWTKQKQEPTWMPLLDLLPALRASQGIWAPFSSGYLKIEERRIQRWSTVMQRTPGKRLIALHWQGNPSHEQSLYSRGRSLPFEQLIALHQLADVEFVSIQKGAGSEQYRTDQGLNFVPGQGTVNKTMDFREIQQPYSRIVTF